MSLMSLTSTLALPPMLALTPKLTLTPMMFLTPIKSLTPLSLTFLISIMLQPGESVFTHFERLLSSRDPRPSESENYHRLHQKLFSNYSSVERPTAFNAYTTNVFAMFAPIRLIYLSDKRQSFKIGFTLYFWWYDDNLKWESSKYGNIKTLHRPQIDIWLPPIIYFNTLDESTQLGFDRNVIEVKESGEVQWRITNNKQFSCAVDIRLYPFDVQKCTVDLVIYQYNASDVFFRTAGMEHTPLKPILETQLFDSGGTWRVLKLDCSEINVTRHGGSTFRMTRYEFLMCRRKKYFLINIMCPLIFLSFAAPAVFLVPAEDGEKMSLGITILLAYSIYLSTVSDELPRTSEQTCVLQVYLMILYGCVTAVVLLSVLVLRVHHRSSKKPVGPCIKRAVRVTRRFLYLHPCRNIKTEQKEQRVNENNNMSAHTRKGSDNASQVSTPNEYLDSESVTDSSKGGHIVNIPEDGSSIYSQAEEMTYPSMPEGGIARSLSAAPDPMEIEIAWPKVAETLDRVLYIVFSLTFCSLTFVTFLTLYYYSASLVEVKTIGDRPVVADNCRQEEIELFY